MRTIEQYNKDRKFTFKIRGNFNREMVVDISATYGIDVESEITSVLAREFSEYIDRTIVFNTFNMEEDFSYENN
jgi:hypothetical protein